MNIVTFPLRLFAFLWWNIVLFRSQAPQWVNWRYAIQGKNFDDRHVFLGILAWTEIIFATIALGLMLGRIL